MLSKKYERRNIVHCTDGSLQAYAAFENALKEFTGPEDYFYVIHISDCTKLYLPEELRVPKIIEKHKLLLLSNLPNSRYAIIIQERDHKNFGDVKEQLAYETAKVNPSYVFLGSFGRKNEQENVHRVGHSAMYMAQITKNPLCIVKKSFRRFKNDTKGYNFICCIDGSHKSLDTLATAKDLARHENDKIYAVTALKAGMEYSPVQETSTQLVQEKAAELGIAVQHFFVEVEDNDVGRTLEFYVNSSEKIIYDYVLVGGCGLRAESIRGYFLGSIVTYMIKHSYVNPVLVP